MEKYDNYKDSGIEWIGEIPEHWEVKKVNYCFAQIGSGTTPTAGKSEYYENGEFNWLQTGDLNDNEIFETSKKVTQEALNEYSTLRFYPKNSLVIAMYGATIGKTGLLRIESTTNQACCVLSKPKNLNHRFVFYWLNYVKPHVISLSYGGGQPNINQEQIRNLKIQCPPPEEQTAIANYLDRKTAEIDELIADKKRLLELYEEEKTAIINQAVTKGINPNAPMKDSGIEWLGDIPEHWEVKRLKYVANIVLGKMLTSEDKGEYQLKPYLRAANLGWIHVNVEDVKEMWFSERELEKYLVKKNDLLVSEGGEVGRTCIWNEELEECYIQNSVHKVTMNGKNDSNYFLQLFYLYGKKGAFDLIVNRISIAHLTVEKLKEVEFIVPPLEEQHSIVQHIETETERINQKVATTEKLIELLTEYRQALISEVVTGKIKVTE